MARTTAAATGVYEGISDPGLREVAATLRTLLLEVLPDDVTEYVDRGDVGYGWGRAYRDLICIVGIHRGQVTLALLGAAHLDAGGEGGGDDGRRHVRLDRPEDADRPELRELVEQTVAHHAAKRG